MHLSALAERYANVTVLDCALLQESAGLESLTSDAYWYLGRSACPLLPASADAFEARLRVSMTASSTRRARLLVLDLDNALWSGVVGEDGIGDTLSEEGVGKCSRDFAARDQGVEVGGHPPGGSIEE